METGHGRHESFPEKCLFLLIVNGPAGKRALWSVLKIEHVACGFTQVRKLYAFTREVGGFMNRSRRPTRTDIDADDFVS
jgi:hypothetical protein